MKRVDFCVCRCICLISRERDAPRLVGEDGDWLVLILSSLKLIYSRGKKLFIKVGFNFRTVYHFTSERILHQQAPRRRKTKKKNQPVRYF